MYIQGMAKAKLLVQICLYCLKCMKFGQLFLRKVRKIVATRWGRERGKGGEGRGGEGKGKEGEGRGKEGEGRGREGAEPPYNQLPL